MNILAPITQDTDAVNKAYVDGLLAEYTKTANLGALASRNSLAFSELTGKPTTLEGYGITDALGKNDTAASASKLATARTIWGQSFDGTKDITGHATFPSGITVDGEQAVLGVVPDGGTFPRFRVFSHLSGFYFQAASYDGTSDKGNIQFSGMYGANAAEVHFKSDYTQFHGRAVFMGGIKISAGQAISFLDSDGVEHKMTYDSDKAAFKIEGNFFATGQNAAGNAGTEVVDIEELASRVTALESSSGGASNLEIKVSALSSYNQQSITSAAMTTLTGLTVAHANSMLNGEYNKVVDKSGTYPKVWNYSATRSSNVISLFFAYGDGFNSKEGCRLDFNTTTLRWDVSIEEL